MKTLSELNKNDVAGRVTVLCNKAEIIIEYDKYNDKWIYTSNDIACAGDFYGSFTEFKKYLKEKVYEAIGEHLEKYTGYGYHGGGRKRKDVEARRKTISISGTPSEIAQLKERAEKSGQTVSRYVLENLLATNNIGI